LERIWLDHYPHGIPAQIDLDEFASVVDVLDAGVKRYRGQVAYVNFGHSLTYGEVDRLSRRFAAYLQQVLGFRKGERFALMLPNLLQYPVALFGVLRAGLVAVNVNPLYSARELAHQLNDSGARGILVVENCAHTLQRALREAPVEAVVTTRLGDLLPWPRRLLLNFAVKHVKRLVPRFSLPGAIPLPTALARGGQHQCPDVRLGHDDIAFLQYTGGTTGRPKGATLTHGNLVANLQQAAAWLKPWLEEGKETVVTALPLYHVFALTANCLVFVKIGGRNVLITNPRDLPGLVRELKRQPFSVITGVNTLFNGLLNTPGFADVDFSRLKVTLGGGMAVQRAVAQRWKQTTGKPIVEAYGLTETAPAACINPLDLADYNGSVGLPLPSTDCKIVDDDDRELAPGERGELCIRGPQVMSGYWNNPGDPRAAFTTDGFVRTGDIAYMDDNGYFYIVDRKKDMILVSGFNVYPNEVEDVVATCSGVVEAACVGMPDEKSGEAVKLVVVRRDDSVTAEDILAYCRDNLAAYKCPKQIEFRTALPKSQVGKILRKDLKSGSPE